MYSEGNWQVELDCVLPRGESGSFDARVVGDPCIVWDEELDVWRMFYFASGPHGCSTAHALSRSSEEVAAGDWRKGGKVPLSNPDDLAAGNNWHKWWVVMEAGQNNRAARIDGLYWSLLVSRNPSKVIQAAHAERLSGPWRVLPAPILTPGSSSAPDGLDCDTPTAYWVRERNQVLIFYKGYPKTAQAVQPQSPFGSALLSAWWTPAPTASTATKSEVILRPDGRSGWASGWIGGFQLLGDADQGWHALLNASPTAPEDDSHREPAPSLGGWAVCQSRVPWEMWQLNNSSSPLLEPSRLKPAEIEAGMGVNFWRHHLLSTPSGQSRIYFNSGEYGCEQMYSLIANPDRA